jgi:hypothetical protein
MSTQPTSSVHSKAAAGGSVAAGAGGSVAAGAGGSVAAGAGASVGVAAGAQAARSMAAITKSDSRVNKRLDISSLLLKFNGIKSYLAYS